MARENRGMTLARILSQIGELGFASTPAYGAEASPRTVEDLAAQQGLDMPADTEAPVDDQAQQETETERRRRENLERKAKENDQARDGLEKVVSQFDDTTVADSFRAQMEEALASRDPTQKITLVNGVMRGATSVLVQQGKKRSDFDINTLPPDIQEYARIKGVTPEDIGAMLRERYKAPGGDSGSYKINREGLDPRYSHLTDADVSDLYKKQIEAENQPKSDVYPRLKGTSLKIMNDDTFKRSGLKTGDTVCIRIP